MRAAFFFRRPNALCARLHADHFGRPGARASERETALAAETIKHASSFRVLGHEWVIRQLIQVKAGLLRMQEIDCKFHSGDFDFDLARRRA